MRWPTHPSPPPPVVLSKQNEHRGSAQRQNQQHLEGLGMGQGMRGMGHENRQQLPPPVPAPPQMVQSVSRLIPAQNHHTTHHNTRNRTNGGRERPAPLHAQPEPAPCSTLIVKIPPRSYSSSLTGNNGVGVAGAGGSGTTQGGHLLSQLMNPDPGIFPVEHPYRIEYFSSGDLREPYQQMREGGEIPRRQTQTQVGFHVEAIQGGHGGQQQPRQQEIIDPQRLRALSETRPPSRASGQGPPPAAGVQQQQQPAPSQTRRQQHIQQAQPQKATPTQQPPTQGHQQEGANLPPTRTKTLSPQVTLTPIATLPTSTTNTDTTTGYVFFFLSLAPSIF